MSVLIKGMKIPNNCGACPLRLAWCRERLYMVTRPPRCPLIELPDHGDLIDRTKLLHGSEIGEQGLDELIMAKDLCVDMMVALKAARKLICDQPVVIPAERSEDDE